MSRYFASGDVVIPAKAGIQWLRRPRICWMPAFAGMTREGNSASHRRQIFPRSRVGLD